MPLVARKRGDKAYFWAGGPDVEPPEWRGRRFVPEGERRRWYAILGAEMYVEKVREWRAGLDAYGRHLAPVRIPRTSAPSDWHGLPYSEGFGPPLLPYPIRALSRGFNLFRLRTDSKRALLYWLPLASSEGREKWSRILVMHATELPIIRDVIGLSPPAFISALYRALARFRSGRGPRLVRFPRSSGEAPTPGAGRIRIARTGGRRLAGAAFSYFDLPRPIARRRRGALPATPRRTAEIDLAAYILLADDRPTLFQAGDRWLVASGGWGWEVFANGETALAPIDAYDDGSDWRPVDPEADGVPELARRTFYAVASGELAPS